MRKDRGDRFFENIMMVFPCLVLLIVGGMVLQLIWSSWPSIRAFGLAFVYRSEWDPVFENFGAFPFVYGTLLTSALALLIAVPIGVGTAIYLAEYAPRWLSKSVSLLVDLLAAIPSVIYGLWGIFILVPLMRESIQPFLAKYFGYLPFFKGPIYGIGFLPAGVILAVMIVPFIISVSREVILAVPAVFKEASYAVGSTRWEAVTKVVLSYGKPGILGAAILALGRAIGETMAVTMIIGNNAKVTASLFSPGYTLASVLANEFAEATTDMYLSSLMEVGLLLFLVSVFVNMLARALIWSVKRPVKAPVAAPCCGTAA